MLPYYFLIITLPLHWNCFVVLPCLNLVPTPYSLHLWLCLLILINSKPVPSKSSLLLPTWTPLHYPDFVRYIITINSQPNPSKPFPFTWNLFHNRYIPYWFHQGSLSTSNPPFALSSNSLVPSLIDSQPIPSKLHISLMPKIHYINITFPIDTSKVPS